MLTRPGLVTMLATVVALSTSTSARAGQRDATTPPAHASGGWAETGPDGEPKGRPRTPEQQAAIEEVTGELKRLVTNFGPDSVVLQAKFLMRSVSAGATDPTEVRVAGPSSVAGPGHLEIDIETGLVFEEADTTPESRREAVWKGLAFPVLDEMSSFKIEPASLELVFLFDVRHRQAPDAAAADEQRHHEAFRVQLKREILDELAADQVVGDALRQRVQLTEAVTVPKPSR